MMDSVTLFGFLSGFFIIVSMLPYAWGIYRGHIIANRVSWSIWAFIGMVLFLTSLTNPQNDFISILYAFVLMMNPMIIVLVSVFKGKTLPILIYEKVALLIAFLAMALWVALDDRSSILPLFLAVLADASALIPTLIFVYRHPADDRPLMWSLFFAGTLFSIAGMQHYSYQTLLLPVYMLVGVSGVLFPLVRYRVQNGLPLREWV